MFFSKKRNRKPPPDVTSSQVVKIRGGSERNLFNNEMLDTRPNRPRNYIPRGLNRNMVGAVGVNNSLNSFSYKGYNRAEFYRWLRDLIPIVNNGISTWVRLCATQMEQIIEGGDSNSKLAAEILDSLDMRIIEAPYGRGSGFNKLTEAYFLELFTLGRFAGEAILTKDGKSIDHFRFIDPFYVGWEHTSKGWIPFVWDPETEEKETIDPERFFYGTLNNDLSNPQGSEPLATLPFVVEIEQLMLEDMARSSHNAGTPRLQVKISRPPAYMGEGEEQYADRANTYFQDVVSEFKNLEPDDNIFTWEDVEVEVVGANGVSQNWRLGREQVIEDVITGLKLFPWILGRSHKTTQNWVQSQFDLLMEMVEAHQKTGADLVNWLCNLELKLQGNNSVVRHSFQSHPDPFRMDKAKAERQEIDNIDYLVQRGYISKEEGAERLGLSGVFREDS